MIKVGHLIMAGQNSILITITNVNHISMKSNLTRTKAFVLISILVCLIWTSCNNDRKGTIVNGLIVKSDTINISSDTGNYSDFIKGASELSFVVLKEDDKTMFADINRIIDFNDKYFIVDSYGVRTVVSFDHDGNPIASYGKRGNGPGEYVYPWAVDVDDKNVYILDASQKKLMKYTHDGSYQSTKEMPFRAGSFIMLDSNKILFNLEPSEETSYQLCITDSTLTPLTYMLPYPKDYVGGWITNDVFRKTLNGITYYLSPADTIYHINLDGHIDGKRILNLKNGALPEDAKLNYIAAESKGLLEKGSQLLNNPVEVASGIFLSEIYDKQEKFYIIGDLKTGECHAKKYGENMSVHDAIIPYATSQDNKCSISILDNTIAEDCIDFQSLPDSIINAMNNGNRVLVIHRFN